LGVDYYTDYNKSQLDPYTSYLNTLGSGETWTENGEVKSINGIASNETYKEKSGLQTKTYRWCWVFNSGEWQGKATLSLVALGGTLKIDFSSL